jgi:alcohol dehydrogenase class IV
MRFEFATATRILFGPGTVREVAPLALSLGRRALLLTGHSVERAAPLLSQLKEQGIETETHQVVGEPTIESVLTAVQRARDTAPNLIIGMGGGSVVDHCYYRPRRADTARRAICFHQRQSRNRRPLPRRDSPRRAITPSGVSRWR